MFFLQMAGFPGTGKSTLAKQIGLLTNAIVLDHDVVKTAILEDRDEHMDSNKAGKMAYKVEWALTDYHLSQGKSVVLDSPCFYTEGLVRGMQLAKKYSVKYKYIECYLDDFHEVNRRLQNRDRLLSQIEKVESKDYFQKALVNSKKPENGMFLVIDTSSPLISYIQKAITYLKE
ncbi:AAA family ATPase [Bacillus suaedaesalsae]|uniref:AAA family ATPase n=1 Tax=Bacillus suaedaesalsae TaxID=2810349 RepID=A0ABS2DMC1_9BACI|nr:AAA family ATPase [Bacillus suaedaesalsae]MBM6619497.1 AAA family ATPase [Bacillus suaedaesalsae]